MTSYDGNQVNEKIKTKEGAKGRNMEMGNAVKLHELNSETWQDGVDRCHDC